MGWIKQSIKTSEEIFSEICEKYPIWGGSVGDSTTPYEYWCDYLRDNYNLTLQQCDEICEGLKEFYNIEHFYYGE